MYLYVDTSFSVNAINYIIAATIFEYFRAGFLARSDGTRDTVAGRDCFSGKSD